MTADASKSYSCVRRKSSLNELAPRVSHTDAEDHAIGGTIHIHADERASSDTSTLVDTQPQTQTQTQTQTQHAHAADSTWTRNHTHTNDSMGPNNTPQRDLESEFVTVGDFKVKVVKATCEGEILLMICE